MPQTLNNSFIVKFAIFIPLLWIVFGYFFINQRISAITEEEYSNVAKDMKFELQTLINEKAEAVLIIALSIKKASEVMQALDLNNDTIPDLKKFSLELRQYTSLKNIGFQIINSDGISVYRSWTDKKGDNLSDVRLDVAKMITYPKVSSTISTGKFDLTFKSMVPIYKDGEFIGLIEALAKFNSISKKMTQKGYDIAILVDKKYKEQLTHPFTKKFLENNYIANLDVSEELLNTIKTQGFNSFKNMNNFKIDKEKKNLYGMYILNDILDKPMAYMIMKKNIENFQTESVIRVRDRLVLIFTLIFFFLVIFIYYIYTTKYKNFIQDINRELEEKVTSKTKELYEQSKELDYLAHHDSLTSLPNRLLFNDRLKQSIRHAKRNNTLVTILFLDLDRFKEVNDTYGHDVGDELLKVVTQRLKSIVREEDTISRLGGDEFTILMDNITQTDIVKIAEKIISSMQEKVIINNKKIYTTFSIGISTYPDDGDTLETLVRNADSAMYQAKENGKNTYRFYNKEMTQKALKKLEIKNELRHVVKRDELEAYYQPKIDARDGSVVGLEALVRWNHPQKGLIFPDTFIPIAQENHLIVDIDNWMLEKAIDTVVQWNLSGIKTGKVSVNLSAQKLESEELLQRLQTIISKSALHASLLEIEITEGKIMKNPELAINILEEIKKMGISIAIDDFGTGYSSLSYLKKFPIDILKIDRSFIDGIPDDEHDIAITTLIIALSKSLNIDVIAEGAETQEHIDFLLEANCPYVQGYYFSKPLNATDCKEFLTNRMHIIEENS